MNKSPGHPIKILHVFRQMVRGGAEMRTLDLMRHIDRENYKFYFCALSGMPGEFDEEIRSLGGDVFYVKLDHTFIRRFKHLLRRNRFDVVHSHVHMFSGFLLRLAAKEQIPSRIAHFRNTNDGRGDSIRRRVQNRLMRRWIDKHATDILAVCEGAMVAAWGSNWQKDSRCRVIYNGIDIPLFEKQPSRIEILKDFNFPMDCTLYIHVGRFVHQKNQKRVVSIFKSIISNNRSARLLLVGRGGSEVEDSVRKNIIKLGLSGEVVFAGERSDVPRLLKASDLLIFPSIWEGLPGVVLESCAAGTPVLASDLPGTREIAAQLPDLVHLLPLDVSDVEWAATAEKIASGVTSCYRMESQSFFDFSECSFNIERCLMSLCNVWDRRS